METIDFARLLRQNAQKFLMEDMYRNPGPLQYDGPGADAKAVSLCVEDQDYMGRIKKLQGYLDQVLQHFLPLSSFLSWQGLLSCVYWLCVLWWLSGEDDSETRLLARCIESGTECNGFGDWCSLHNLIFFHQRSTICLKYFSLLLHVLNFVLVFFNSWSFTLAGFNVTTASLAFFIDCFDFVLQLLLFKVVFSKTINNNILDFLL